MRKAVKIFQGAIKHPGSLRRFAKAHHAITKQGTINLDKAERVAKTLPGAARGHRLRQINLARTLRRLRA